MSEKTLLCLALILFITLTVHASTDVLDYSTTLEPDIANKCVKGSVSIRVRTDSREVVFDCGELIIDSVQENGKPVEFSVNDHKLKVSLAGAEGKGILKADRFCLKTRNSHLDTVGTGSGSDLVNQWSQKSLGMSQADR